MQRFHENTLESSFIKSIIRNTPLPIIRTVHEGDYIYAGHTYIYKTYIIKCLTSGQILDYTKYKSNLCSNDNLCSPYNLVRQYFGEYRIDREFVLGNYYDQLTKYNVCTSSYYNSETHELLGEYLRCLRDIYAIDLMPFYNCYSDRQINTLYLSEEKNLGYKVYTNNDYKILSIPIKYNKDYTIAIDCQATVNIRPMVMNSLGPIQVVVGGKNYNLSGEAAASYMLNGDSVSNTRKLPFLSFKQPILVNVPNGKIDEENTYIDELLGDYEKYLKLIIQLPKTNSSTIVVLEGDYRGKNQVVLSNNTYVQRGPEGVVNSPELNDIDQFFLNPIFLSALSLLRVNDGEQHPFANRLIEYLLGNVVTSHDYLAHNVIRAQMYTKVYNSKGIYKGVWNNYFRKYLYDFYMKTRDPKTSQFDITGFIDKDMEYLITKGLSV